MAPTDDERWATLYREVPSAFWLDPAMWGSPQPPPPVKPAQGGVGFPRLPGIVLEWRGRRVLGWYEDVQRMGYMLKLEGGEQVFVTARMLANVMSRFR